MYSWIEKSAVTGTIPSSSCGSTSRSAALAAPVSTSSPSYTCSASQLIATGSSPRSRSRRASSTQTPVFPTPVGPKMARTID